MNRILYWPYVRYSILISFKNLLNEEFRQTWFSDTAKHRFWNSLDYYVFDYLLNAPQLLDNDWKAYEVVGITLYNKREAEILSEYLIWYNDTFEGEMPDSYYINHPQWLELLDRAKQILDMMEANNQKYNSQADLDQWDEEQDKGLDHGTYPSDEDRANFTARSDD